MKPGLGFFLLAAAVSSDAFGEVALASPHVSASFSVAAVSSQNIEIEDEIERLTTRARAGDATRADYIRLAALHVESGNGLSAEAAVERARRLGASEADTAILFAKSKLIQMDYGAAVAALRGIQIDGSQEFDAIMVRADAYFALLDLSRAETLYRRARALDESDFQPVLGLTRLALRRDNLEGAKLLVQEAANLGPNETMVLYTQGLIERFIGNREAAKGFFQQALDVYGQNVLARVELAAALVDEADFTGAEEELDRIFEITARNQRARYLSAVVLVQKGEYEAAYSILSDLGRFVTGYLPGEYVRGLVAYETGRDQIAVEALTKVLAARPTHRVSRLMLAATQLRRRRPSASMQLVSSLIEARPDDREALEIAASAAAALGDAQASRDFYARLAALEGGENQQSTRVTAQERLALAHLATGNSAIATALLSNVVSQDASDIRNLGLLANILIRDKEFEEAGKQAEAIIKVAPNQALGYNILGSVRHYQQRYADAYALYGQALDRQDDYHTARRNRALAALALGRYRDVESDMEAFIRVQPADARAKAALGRAKLALGKNEEALDLFIETRRAIPRSPDLEVDLFLARARSGQTAQAVRDARRALFLAVDRPLLLRRLGEELMAMGEASLAARATGRYVAFNPERAEAHILHGRAQLLGGLYTGGLTSFQRAEALIDASDMDVLRWYQFAAEVRMGRGEQAIVRLPSLIPNKRPEDVPASLEAQAFVSAGLDTEALAAYERIYRVEPSSELARGRASALWRLGRQDEAITVLERDDKRTGAFDRLLLEQLGDYLGIRGKLEAARQAYEKILREAGVDPVVLGKLAKIYLELGDRRAVTLAGQAYLSRPNDPEILSIHGWVLLQGAGDAEKAIESLERATRREPGRALYRYQLGMAYLKQGRRFLARDALRAALALDENFEAAADARKQLDQLE